MEWIVYSKILYVLYTIYSPKKIKFKRTQALQEQPNQRHFSFSLTSSFYEAKARHLDENDGDTSGLLNLEQSVLSRLQDDH